MSSGADESERFYRRRLPHWLPAGAAVFVTWRLHGSLPQQALDRLAEERRLLSKLPAEACQTQRDRTLYASKRLFALSDQMLAGVEGGPRWLSDDRLAELVVDALFHHDGSLYTLLSFVIMPNHVHVMLHPLPGGAHKDNEGQGPDGDVKGAAVPIAQYVGTSPQRHVALSRITQSLKGFTARQANGLLQRTGKPFWQDESYDHWVRDDGELLRIGVYIESDPVRAGLVASPEEWRWSSAWEREFGRWRELK